MRCQGRAAHYEAIVLDTRQVFKFFNLTEKFVFVFLSYPSLKSEEDYSAC